MLANRALRVGAEWVQLGEVVTASEVLTDAGRREAL
jgi:hypothetical protein